MLFVGDPWPIDPAGPNDPAGPMEAADMFGDPAGPNRPSDGEDGVQDPAGPMDVPPFCIGSGRSTRLGEPLACMDPAGPISAGIGEAAIPLRSDPGGPKVAGAAGLGACEGGDGPSPPNEAAGPRAPSEGDTTSSTGSFEPDASETSF